MPQPILIQQCSWPGVTAVAEAYYMASWGIAPGTAYITTYPQPVGQVVASFGNFTIGDGQRSLTLYNCRVSRITGEAGPDGQTWTIEIQDRRWQWQGLGAVGIDSNALDFRSKLVPWSIYSPQEIATICLNAMGETNFDVSDLPTGLVHADGADVERYLQAGENFQQSLCNPHITLDHSPPMEALARLADSFGCVVVLQHSTNTVRVVKIGHGISQLPNVPCDSIAEGITQPRIPAAVAVAGAPIRYQMRFALEPVGEEWDGKFIPVNELSYTPQIKGQPSPQITTVTYTGSSTPQIGVTITVNPGTQQQQQFLIMSSGPFAISTQIGGIANRINANPTIAAVLTATNTATVLTLTGNANNVQFGVLAYDKNVTSPDSWIAMMTQVPAPANKRSWCFCPPPEFYAVTESTAIGPAGTPRLSYAQALQKAQKYIWKAFRIMNINVTTGKPPMVVPNYSKPIVRRQQIVLQSGKVEQVVPQPRIPGGGNANNPINPRLASEFGILAPYYDGYSKDRPAECFGSVYMGVGGQVIWQPNGNLNTPIGTKVFVDFEIDPYEQIVLFSDYVFQWISAGVVGAPNLILETACLVKDATYGFLERYEQTLPLGGNAPTQWEIHEDVGVGVIQQYVDIPGGQQNKDNGWKYGDGDIADATGKAGYYLAGMAARFQAPQGDHRAPIGIYPLDLDGCVQQVSYSIGPGGPSTHWGLNTEFSVSLPDYPKRRRAENLPPDAAAAAANKREAANAQLPYIDPNFGKQ